ncbi:MAG: hypothetical protein RLY98_859 [Bacteroidota bacterium]|jgi:two-component system sensor histidine kinase YesM
MFRRIRFWFSKVNLRWRLTISYILLIIISLSLLGAGYYFKSSDVILQNASETSLGLVKMGTRSLDAKFANVEQQAINMHVDEQLFEFFNTTDLEERYISYEHNREITRNLMKYFPDSPDYYSVNLITSEYTFGNTPSFWFPRTNLKSSIIYQKGTKATTNTSWIPTYNLLEQFYSSKASDRFQYVFSATRYMNLSSNKNNVRKFLDENVERPILVVNFQETLIEKTLKESLNIKGSYYYVMTPNGHVLSTSRDRDEKNPIDENWLTSAAETNSGTEYIQVDNKKMIVCYSIIPSTGWITAVFIPYNNLLSTVPNMLSYTIFAAIVILLVAVILASIISGKITLPLKKLLWGINRIGEGNFDTKIIGTDILEINTIIRRFNQMNQKIGTLIEENYEVKLKELEAELNALNFQFNPHFLYNTLNIINYLAIENKQTQISEMLVELSKMLEFTTKTSGEVKFQDDFEYLKNYVFIMNLRFEGKFSIKYDFPDELMETKVPKFFLQPFIENSLIHGLSEIEHGGQIKVAGRLEDGIRIFEIEDNGKGMSQEKIKSVLTKIPADEFRKSIGINNVDQRIKLLYGKQYGVQIHAIVDKGTKVTIYLP